MKRTLVCPTEPGQVFQNFLAVHTLESLGVGLLPRYQEVTNTIYHVPSNFLAIGVSDPNNTADGFDPLCREGFATVED